MLACRQAPSPAVVDAIPLPCRAARRALYALSCMPLLRLCAKGDDGFGGVALPLRHKVRYNQHTAFSVHNHIFQLELILTK